MNTVYISVQQMKTFVRLPWMCKWNDINCCSFKNRFYIFNLASTRQKGFVNSISARIHIYIGRSQTSCCDESCFSNVICNQPTQICSKRNHGYLQLGFLSSCQTMTGIVTNAPSQWKTTLHCNGVSHWLGPYTKWSLHDTLILRYIQTMMI